jgi:hypothetical protein
VVIANGEAWWEGMGYSQTQGTVSCGRNESGEGSDGGRWREMDQGALEVIDNLIREYLEKKIPQSVIAHLLNVHRLTVRNYIRTRKLQKPSP